MIKDVIIDIKTEQTVDSNTDQIEFTTDGRFGFKDGSYYIAVWSKYTNFTITQIMLEV